MYHQSKEGWNQQEESLIAMIDKFHSSENASLGSHDTPVTARNCPNSLDSPCSSANIFLEFDEISMAGVSAAGAPRRHERVACQILQGWQGITRCRTNPPRIKDIMLIRVTRCNCSITVMQCNIIETPTSINGDNGKLELGKSYQWPLRFFGRTKLSMIESLKRLTV